MSKAYYRVSEFSKEVLEGRKVVFDRGFDIGFHSADPYISLKKGFTSYIYASPFSGKTSFVFDIYMHIAKKYDEVIAIYSPEAGGKIALVSYLVQVYLGKKLHGEEKQEATDDEWLEAMDFIDKHFILLAPQVVGKDKIEFNTKEMFSQIHAAEKQYGVKIGILLIDPHTMLRKDDEERKKSIADYILDNLYYINHVAEAMNIHIQIAMHTKEEDTVVDKDTGIEYLPKPFPSKLANGQNVFRTGQTMLGMWRCPGGVIERNTGMPYPMNATDFLMQKNKVFGAGDVGTFRLYYDITAQKFYEIVDGVEYYCGEYEEQFKNTIVTGIQPSRFFDDDSSDDIFK